MYITFLTDDYFSCFRVFLLVLNFIVDLIIVKFAEFSTIEILKV